MISKTKDRRLLLLNDLLVCVTVASKSGDDYRNSSERLTLKWAFPVTDVEASPSFSLLYFTNCAKPLFCRIFISRWKIRVHHLHLVDCSPPVLIYGPQKPLVALIICARK